MYSKLTLAQKYLHYYFTALNGKGHGIHSPFVFDFVANVLNDERDFYAYSQIENLRQKLLTDAAIIQIEDFGAGSSASKTNQRKVCDIARHAAKNKKLAQLLFRIANHYQPKIIIELGTSLGISSSYLASANPDSSLITMEGSFSLAEIARKNFHSLGLKNIQSITGNFDDVLTDVLKNKKTIDLAFIDGNHRKEPTIKYFHQLIGYSSPLSIFIFDDIHWSKEMEEAWNIIKASAEVTLSIDLFFIGLVFFRKDFKAKQDFIIRF
jgi:predicted O-methyltransferase YrrM